MANYWISPNGTTYRGVIELRNADRYDFSETGMLGERIPVHPENVKLSGSCSPCPFNWSGTSTILFPEGNYTLSFNAPIRENHFTVQYDEPYQVWIELQQGIDIRNPLLGAMNPGAEVREGVNDSVVVKWDSTRLVDIRFYDKAREDLLYLFANFWIIIAIVMLLPFLMMRKRKMP